MNKCYTKSVLGCANEAPMLYVYTVDAAWALVIGLLGFGLLWHRVINKKMSIFHRGSGYFFRPKPIESLLLFLSLSCIVEAVSNILTLINTWSNFFSALFLASLPREFDTCAFSCYLFGIAHTVCSSHKFGNRRYAMSKRIDIICTTLIILPFITSNISIIGMSVYKEQLGMEENMKEFNTFFRIHYYQWLVYWLILAVWILVAGLQLIKILKKHLHNQSKDNIVSIQNAQNGLFKARMTTAIGICSMVLFMFSRYFYTFMGVYQENYNVTLGFTIIIVFHNTLASTLIIMTILLNPKALNPLSASSLDQYNSTDPHANNTSSRSSFIDCIGESTLVPSNVKAQKETVLKY